MVLRRLALKGEAGMFCGKCGRQLIDKGRFCGYCGTEVLDLKKVSVPKEKKSMGNKKTKIIIGIVSIMIIFAIIIIKSKVINAGPYIDRNFIETFPFKSGSISEVENWVTSSKDYRIIKTDLNNNTVKLLYKPNNAWNVEAGCEVYGIDGYLVLWEFTGFANLIKFESVYKAVVSELIDICGSPVDIRGNSDVYEFDYRGLNIVAILFSDSVMVQMSYKE